MLAGRLVFYEVWCDDRLAIVIPVSVDQFLSGDDSKVIKYSSLVKLALDGLDVKKRQTRLEVDRDVRLF